MPPRTPTDREDDRSDERLDRDAPRALRRDPEPRDPEPRDPEPRDRDEENDERTRDARHDPDDAPKHEEASAADRLAAEVEPKTDPVEAVETLVKNVVDEMRTAPDAHELGEHFSGEARRLAEAALANTGGLGGGTAAPEAGFSPAEVANGDQAPHNRTAVESAVAHGVDRDLAHAMTTHGSNS